MRLFSIHNALTAARAVIGWPLAMMGICAALYFGAAIVGSLIPVNDGWKSPRQGIAVYLHDNGIHTSIIIPCAASADDPCLFPNSHLPHPDFAARYQMVGWGDRAFYLDTPRWRDTNIATAITALRGSGRTLIHVDHLQNLPAKGVKKILVSKAEFAAIKSQLLAAGNLGQPVKGYGTTDVFYESGRAKNGRPPPASYSIFYICNNWASDILAKAGVRAGYWTPLSAGVMWSH